MREVFPLSEHICKWLSETPVKNQTHIQTIKVKATETVCTQEATTDVTIFCSSKRCHTSWVVCISWDILLLSHFPDHVPGHCSHIMLVVSGPSDLLTLSSQLWPKHVRKARREAPIKSVRISLMVLGNAEQRSQSLGRGDNTQGWCREHQGGRNNNKTWKGRSWWQRQKAKEERKVERSTDKEKKKNRSGTRCPAFQNLRSCRVQRNLCLSLKPQELWDMVGQQAQIESSSIMQHQNQAQEVLSWPTSTLNIHFLEAF